MKSTQFKVASAVALAAMLVCVIASVVCGGCPKQLTTTAGGTCYMKCWWCFRATAVVGVVGAASSLLLLLARDVQARRSLSILAAVGALCCILLNATPIIGICSGADMQCSHTALVVNIACACGIVACAWAFLAAKGADERPKMGL